MLLRHSIKANRRPHGGNTARFLSACAQRRKGSLLAGKLTSVLLPELMPALLADECRSSLPYAGLLSLSNRI